MGFNSPLSSSALSAVGTHSSSALEVVDYLHLVTLGRGPITVYYHLKPDGTWFFNEGHTPPPPPSSSHLHNKPQACDKQWQSSIYVDIQFIPNNTLWICVHKLFSFYSYVNDAIPQHKNCELWIYVLFSRTQHFFKYKYNIYLQMLHFYQISWRVFKMFMYWLYQINISYKYLFDICLYFIYLIFYKSP